MRQGTKIGRTGLVLGAALALPSVSFAQGDQFGGQARADAAARMIVLGVQQGISSLPPTSGQSFTYEYDAELATFVTSERLGPTSFRSPQTVGAGKLSVRGAVSYFELSDEFGPIDYMIEPVDPSLPGPSGFAKFGLAASAKVGLINLAANYGIANRFEVMLNLPLVIVNANGFQSFSSRADRLGVPANEAIVSGAPDIPTLNQRLDPSCQETRPASQCLALRHDSFDDLNFDFDDADNLGIGRISIGAKAVLFATEIFQLAFAPEFFFASPNEDEFAGSDSFAVLPRFIAQINATDFLRFHGDVGYDYDFDEATLRRLVFNGGVSLPLQRVTFDLGVGGSEFDTHIRWTPHTTFGREALDANGNVLFPRTRATANDDTRLGDFYLDGLAGFKIRVAEKTVISGAVNVPLNSQGFRADAVGTGAVEVYF